MSYWIRDYCSKIYWPMKISNEVIRNRANISTISEQIFQWRCKFIGHVLRINPIKHPKTALTWAPEGRRSRGRPKETWRRTAEKERTALGFISCNEATVAAGDCATWRRRVSGPIPHSGLWSKLIELLKLSISERITSTFHSFMFMSQ